MRYFVFLLALFTVATGRPQQSLAGSASFSGSAAISSTPVVRATPSMGWNSWLYAFDIAAGQNVNSTAWQPTEAYIEQQCDALVSTGLTALGYTLCSVDGGWGNRDGNGNIQAVPANFPSGAAALGAHIHANGQRFGLYGTPATGCLTGYAEQYQHEHADAVAMASWGIDQFKYDYCSAANTFPTDASLQSETAYFASQLQGQGRKVELLLNFYYPLSTGSGQWMPSVGASSIRVGQDNDQSGVPWYTKAFVKFDWTALKQYQGYGYTMDPDNLMCQIKESAPGGSGLTATVGDAECRTQFNWYAMIGAPLVIGARVTDLTATTLQTLSNTEVIAIDQDALGQMGKRISAADVNCGGTPCTVWVRKTVGGYAVAFFNPDSTAAHTVSVTWAQAGLSGTFNMRDVWAHSSVGSSSTGYTATSIPAWGSVVLTLTQ